MTTAEAMAATAPSTITMSLRSFLSGVASVGAALGGVVGVELGDGDGRADGRDEGAGVLSQQPKYRIAPVCGETPGQHWPESCMARHFG